MIYLINTNTNCQNNEGGNAYPPYPSRTAPTIVHAAVIIDCCRLILGELLVVCSRRVFAELRTGCRRRGYYILCDEVVSIVSSIVASALKAGAVVAILTRLVEGPVVYISKHIFWVTGSSVVSIGWSHHNSLQQNPNFEIYFGVQYAFHGRGVEFTRSYKDKQKMSQLILHRIVQLTTPLVQLVPRILLFLCLISY